MSETEDEGELDPTMERVRKKLVRLLFVSTSIMVLGFAAVIAGIFYRVSQMEDDTPSEPVALEIGAGDLVSVSVDEDHLVLHVGGANPRIEVLRLDDGAIVGTFLLAAPQ
ncbi:MAG: hypothetical protein AAFW98_04735 [Pseudomonadota bacterium]